MTVLGVEGKNVPDLAYRLQRMKEEKRKDAEFWNSKIGSQT